MKIESRHAPGKWSDHMYIDHWTPRFAMVFFTKMYSRRWWAERLAKKTGGELRVHPGNPKYHLKQLRMEKYSVTWHELHQIGE